MFFDDNIRYKDAYIVDAKHASRNSKVPFIASLLQSHLCRAEPLESITDKEYFVKHVARLEKGYERKLTARARMKRVIRLLKTLRCGVGAFVKSPGGIITNPDYDAWKDHRPDDNT